MNAPMDRGADGRVVEPTDAVDLRYDRAAVRRTRIVELVAGASFCSAAELSRELGVSEMTIRRDIHRLAAQGLVRAVHGGASVVTGVMGGSDFRLRAGQHLAAKRAIARHAAGLIRPGSTVGLDAGTTALELARLVPPDAWLSVVTHSLPAMGALAGRNDVTLIGLGGLLRPGILAFVGPSTLSGLEQLRIDVLFLAASAVRRDGVYCADPYDAETKRALIAAADEIVLLADASKFRGGATMRIAPLDALDAIVSDDSLDRASRRWLTAARVDLTLVPLDRAAVAAGA